jgi:hypothetical protein
MASGEAWNYDEILMSIGAGTKTKGVTLQLRRLHEREREWGG